MSLQSLPLKTKTLNYSINYLQSNKRMKKIKKITNHQVLLVSELPWDCTGFTEYISVLLLWTSELSVCTLVINSVTWKCDSCVCTAANQQPCQCNRWSRRHFLTWLPRMSRALCCSSITSLISFLVLRPNASRDCWSWPVTYRETDRWWRKPTSEPKERHKQKRECYRRLNVFHLVAVWQWCHMEWNMCPDLWPLQLLLALWQEPQGSPHLPLLTVYNVCSSLCPKNEEEGKLN